MFSAKAQTWAFRASIVVLNIAALIWIHHRATWTPKPRLRVLSVLPAGEIDSTDRFSFTFDEPLKLAGQVGSPLTEAPFVIQPPTPGEWVWAAWDRVEYRLTQQLPPGRRFKLKASPKLELMTGRTLVGQTEFAFETEHLQWRGASLENADPTHVTVEVRFNQPVEPGELLRHLTVFESTEKGKRGRKLDAQCLTQKPGDHLTLHVARPQTNRLQVEVDGQLAGHGGELTLGSKVTSEVATDQLFALVKAEVDPPDLDSALSVHIHGTRRLKLSQQVPSVKIEPTVPNLSTHLEWSTIVLHGAFVPGQQYKAVVSGNLLSEDNVPLGADAQISFDVPDRQARVSIPFGSGILSPAGNLTLDLKVASVTGLTVRAARVHENNLVAALHGRDKRETSRELPEKKFTLQLEHNQVGSLALSLREMIGDQRGIYSISASATDVNWVNDDAVVAVTDLAITSKTQRDGLYVWVTSLVAGKPVAGAEVRAMSFNGQTLGLAATDASGIARVPVPAGHPDGAPWVVTARLGEDVSFLKLDEGELVPEGVDLSGRDLPKTYDVMLYSERGVYRPGDVVHLTGIVRDTTGVVPPALPMVVRVTRPDGREVAAINAKSDPQQQGMFQVDFASASDGQTGPYRFAVTLPGDKEAIGTTKALVEEYVPVRLEVKADATAPAGKPVVANVKARYLFDQPGAGLAVKAIGKLTRQPFTAAQWKEFTFDEPFKVKAREAKEVSAKLDDQGAATIELLDPATLPTGLWQSDWALTVTEAGGRSVSANAACAIDTAQRHVGLKPTMGRVVRAGAPAAIEWVQVTAAGELAPPGPMTYTLQRVDEDVTLEEVDHRYVWKTVEHLSPVAQGEINGASLPTTRPTSGPAPTTAPDAPGRFEVTCPSIGKYRLRLTETATGATAQIDLHASDEAEAARMLATGEPDSLDVVLDKDKYAPGATAKVLVRSPFAGTLLLTIEAADVVDQRVIDMPGSSLEVEWPVSERLRGGAFVRASVVRAVDPSKDRWLPHRAYGTARLVMDWSQRELPVSIAVTGASGAPAGQGQAKVLPGETVRVKVQGPTPAQPGTPAMVHVWAVDEGILATTAYQTPRPGDHFFAHCKAAVAMTDVFDDLLPDYTRPASITRIGGDGGDEEEALRHSPVPAKQRAAAVVWSTLIPAGPDGAATTEMKLPDLNGEMRLMAVVVNGDTYGSARQALTLASPILVELSAPRFVAPGDVFAMPAKLFNGTDAELRVSTQVQTDGPVEVKVKEPVGEIAIRPGTPVTVWLEGKAAGLGQSKVVVKAIGSKGGDSLTGVSEAMFPVRPAGPLHSETKLMRVKAGEPLKIDPPANFLNGSVRRTVSISGSPTVQLQTALEDLIDYPYGCVEQTTSRLWAILYAPELLGEESAPAPATTSQPTTTSAPAEESPQMQIVRGMIDTGLTRLWSMQTTSGGLAYWPGGREPTLWGSAYAAEFIVQARRLGYKPEPHFLEELAKYLEAALNMSGDGAPDEDQRAQLCYVLALLDRPQQGWMARLAEHVDALDMEGRAHLAGAWLAAGRKDRASAVLTDDTLAGEVATTNGGRLTSQVHAEAVLLNVLLDLDKRHAWIPTLVKRLEKARKAGRWGSTLENAMALAAMARYQATGTTKGRFEGTIVAGGVSRPFSHSAATVFRVPNDAKTIELQSTGEGDIFVSVNTQGLLRDNVALNYDRGLKVTRKWLDRDGKAIDPAKLKIGDLVLVEMSLAAPGIQDGETVDNVAIVDALPGGLEVENPRLATSSAVESENSAQPDRVEFRDDRVLLFASAGETEQVFKYALRVVSTGTFEWPAVQASCMYDAGYASAHGGAAKVSVSK